MNFKVFDACLFSFKLFQLFTFKFCNLSCMAKLVKFFIKTFFNVATFFNKCRWIFDDCIFKKRNDFAKINEIFCC